MANITTVVLHSESFVWVPQWCQFPNLHSTVFPTIVSSLILVRPICCNCLALLKPQNITSSSHCLAAVIHFWVWHVDSFCHAPSHWLVPQGCTIQHPAVHSPNGLACKEFCVSAYIPFTSRGWQTAGMYTSIYENIDWNYKQNTTEPSSGFACTKPQSRCLRNKQGKQRNDKGIKHSLAYYIHGTLLLS